MRKAYIKDEVCKMIKKLVLPFLAVAFLSACQTTGPLRPGEVMGSDIGSILSSEAGLDLDVHDEAKMNSEIEKALFFSENGLTTRWYAGVSARIRPTGDVRDRRDRDCRRFRHSVMVNSDWYNGTAIACRERNVPWYLISNRWDRQPDFDNNLQPDRPRRPIERGRRQGQGKWQNLSDDLRGNPANRSLDDFGPRNDQSW
ncbi:hypothetical protein [Terasakiella sp.]|uniref:hypothetical protein n=1 Tax=unclassified Terasakiella TaxID=2614952 RepID=UPI003AA98714